MMFNSILGAVLATTASGQPPAGSIFGMPPQASTIAGDVDLVYDIITWISIFFFVAIVAVMVYFMIKYRRTSHVASTEGATHHTPLEVTWTIIPLILVIAIFYVGLTGYVNITTPPENAYEIEVTATRWSWTFDYPNGASEGVLYVPAGTPVKLTMSATDVLHALFIPAFRVKQDIVPGRTTELWFQSDIGGTAENPVVYALYCAEYCGQQHSDMVTSVHVLNPDAFEMEMARLAAWIDETPDENLAMAGTRLFAGRCSSCHSVDGTVVTGPSFKETFELFKSGVPRQFKDGSIATVDADYIEDSIRNPLHQIVVNPDTGVAYPESMTLGLWQALGARKVRAMIEMITHLDTVTTNDVLNQYTLDEITGKSEEADE